MRRLLTKSSDDEGYEEPGSVLEHLPYVDKCCDEEDDCGNDGCC